MILVWLMLEGFRLHRRTEITFEPGLTAIVGPNGAGKSTILEAVTFALFGEQRGNRDSLRADDGGPYRVTLVFRLGDFEYEVDRRPDKATLIQGSRKVADGLADTTRACSRLLGLTYEQFRNSFLAEQKGLAFLRFRSSAARQEEVARMLGLDRLRAAENRAADVRRTAGAEAKILEGAVGDEGAIRAAFREAEAASKTASADVQTAEKEVQRTQAELVAAEPAGRAAEAYLGLVASAATAEEALRRAGAARQTAQSAVEAARAEAEELATHTEAAARHEALRALLPEVESAHQALAEAESLDPGGVAPAAELQKLLDTAKREWQVRRESLVAAQATAQQLVRSAETAIQDAERGERGEPGGPCPVCGRPLNEEAHNWREELSVRLQAARATLEQARQAAGEEPPAELTILPTKIRAAERRAEGTARMTAYPAGLEDLRAQLSTLSAHATRARTLAGADRRLRDAEAALEKTTRDFEAAGGAAKTSSDSLAQTGIANAQAARDALALAAQARTAAQAAQAALRAAETAARTGESTLRNSEARLRESDKRRADLQAARYTEHLNAAVAAEMRVLRTKLNGALRPDLEARAGDLLERMTAGRYRRLRLGSDFEATLVDEETDRPVLSGGEEDVLALALRLALAELVQDRKGHSLTLLMLDEAFGSLDTDRRQSLLDVLTGLRDRYEQVLVVTHIEDVAQVADRVLRVERDETGAARVKEA